MREKDTFAKKSVTLCFCDGDNIPRLISFQDRERIGNVQYGEEGTYREMLKEPRPEDVRRDFRKDTSFLLVLLP